MPSAADSPAPAGPRALRIALVAPEPRPGGGVPGMTATLALGLAAAGHLVDLWTVPEQRHGFDWADHPNLQIHVVDSGFHWRRWYSPVKGRLASIRSSLSLLAFQAAASPRMAKEVVAAHAAQPFDVLYRFSTLELLGFGRHLDRLPPLVSHPEVHAAGELRFTRRERHLARRSHHLVHRTVIEGVLWIRSGRQRRAARRVAHLIAPSHRFAELVAADYGIDRHRISVVPNPVDLAAFVPGRVRAEGDPVRVTYVGRAAVRKGIEQLVELSHRLDDLAGRVELCLVCSRSTWSDYTPLLAGVNPRVAVVLGPQPHAQVAEILRQSDVLVQPSHYEPFAITVAEGLASGVPVVATTEVGAVEGLDPLAATVVPAGDVRALEEAVRERVAAVLDGRDGPARARARAEAERYFDPKAVIEQLAGVLAAVADG